MDLGLRGRRALVTGSTAGIGFATAQALASEGAAVMVNGRTEAWVATAVRAIRGAVSGATWAGSPPRASATNDAALRVDGGVVRAVV